MKLSTRLQEELAYGRLGEFVTYHRLMEEIGDIDPQYPMLRYVCDRFELNMEQRYWLAFLTGATYCAPTVYYIYNEFPDYENVDVGRLNRWWVLRGREACVFQSDRAWIRSRNQIIAMFESYKELLGGIRQEDAFCDILVPGDPGQTYDNAYKKFKSVKYFGRFGMFLWLEAVHVVTGFPMVPTTMPWKESSSASSRNGMCYALGYDDLIRGHGFGKEPISNEDFQHIEDGFQDTLDILSELNPNARVDVWNVETSLCAYKKWRLGQDFPERKTTSHYRYVGYYLDRQHDEIAKLSNNVSNGVDWDVLWDFRKETLPKKNLMEYGANNSDWSDIEMTHRMAMLKQGELL